MDAIEQLRADAERDLTGLLRRLNAEARARVAAEIERAGSVEAVPASFWESLKRLIDSDSATLMALLLIGTYSYQYRDLAETYRKRGGSVELPPIDDERLRTQSAGPAARLGRTVADEYIDGVRDRLADRLRSMPPETKPIDVVEEVMDDTQAERVTVTNTTKGISAAQGSAGDDVGKITGVAVDQMWVTERDGKVCPVCAPLDGRPSLEWVERFTQGPPAHPRCRCRLAPYFATEVS